MWNDCSTGKKVIRIKIFHDSDPLLLKMLHAIVNCEISLLHKPVNKTDLLNQRVTTRQLQNKNKNKIFSQYN